MQRRFLVWASATEIALCAFADEPGWCDWTQLFDGKTLNGWTQSSSAPSYGVVHNCIVSTAVPAVTAAPLCTIRQFTNFVLELDLWADARLRTWVLVRGAQSNGVIWGQRIEVGADQSAFELRAWNRVRIEAYGDTIRGWLNDIQVQCLKDTQQRFGYIGLQADTLPMPQPGQVRWRNVRLRELKPTVGLKAPENAIVLFGGMGFDHWTKQNPKEWEAPAGPVGWKLVDDSMEAVPGAGSIITKRMFGDCRIHLEFCILGPVNSGVYVQTRYEVGLKDSFGQSGGVPCGAPGNFVGRTDLRDIPNVAAPPNQWQSLDIEFRAPRFDSDGNKTANARISVWLNGVPLYENYQITGLKGAAKRLGETARGPLMLQEHGAPIRFRNIWLVENLP